MEHLKLVSISFHTAGKIFDFNSHDLDLVPGDKVIVETERGRALGTVLKKPRDITPDKAPPKLKSILRIAVESDLQMAKSNSMREQEALQYCQKRVKQRKMEMKLVRAEYLFDGSKIIFFFTADGRVDFRELVRDLAQYFRTRIEMRQIGVRDEAKQVGGLGICGRELCCSSHLRNFIPVSVKMAKAQGIALNPIKISGQCGRLLCCLAYEYDTYKEMSKTLPKCGKKFQLTSGTAEVISRNILAQRVTLSNRSGERCQMHINDLNKDIAEAKDSTSEATAKQKETSKVPTTKQPGRSRLEKAKQQPDKQKNSTHTKPEESPLDNTASSTQEKRKRRRRRPRRRANRQTGTEETKT